MIHPRCLRTSRVLPWLVLGVGLLLAACDPPTAPAPTRAPGPTADIRLTAADSFLAAMTAYQAAERPAETVCLSATTAPALKRCWSGKLAVQKRFDTSVSAIRFPDDMRADVSTLHYVIDRLASAMSRIAAAAAPAGDLRDLGVYSSASVDFLQITSNLRAELGIVGTPSP